MMRLTRKFLQMLWVIPVLASPLLHANSADNVDADLKPLIAEAKKFWQKESAQQIKIDSKACYDIKTKMMKEDYAVLNAHYPNPQAQNTAYQLLLLKEQLQPQCISKYDQRHDLSASEKIELEMQDREKLPQKVKDQQDREYSQALAERENLQLNQVDAWAYSQDRLQALLSCQNPAKQQVYELFLETSLESSGEEKGLYTDQEDPMMDSALSKSLKLKKALNVYGVNAPFIYRPYYSQFWAVRLPANTNIDDFAKKYGLSKVIDKNMRSKAQAVSEGVGMKPATQSDYAYYAKKVDQGFGEIQLKQIKSDNPFYQSSVKNLDKQWFIGCNLTQPLAQNLVNAEQNKSISKQLQKAVSDVDQWIQAK